MLKRLLLRTRLGSHALAFRDTISLLRCALVSPEGVGTLANDQIAAHLLTSICAPGKTFVDVGAHIGSVIAEVMRRCPESNVIAFEAIPEKAKYLRESFPACTVHCCAVGPTTGEVDFFVHRRQSGYSSLSPPRERINNNVRKITVALRRLDDMVADADIDVIKIDVEGAELGVLQGSLAVLSRCRPIVMFESSTPTSEQELSDRLELFRLFRDERYLIQVPNRVAHEDTGLVEAGFLESHIYPRRTTNYFAVPFERAPGLRHRSREVLHIRT